MRLGLLVYKDVLLKISDLTRGGTATMQFCALKTRLYWRSISLYIRSRCLQVSVSGWQFIYAGHLDLFMWANKHNAIAILSHL